MGLLNWLFRPKSVWRVIGYSKQVSYKYKGNGMWMGGIVRGRVVCIQNQYGDRRVRFYVVTNETDMSEYSLASDIGRELLGRDTYNAILYGTQTNAVLNNNYGLALVDYSSAAWTWEGFSESFVLGKDKLSIHEEV